MGVVEGKVALITGGGRGIGAGIAVAMAKEGARIMICSLERNELDHVCATIRSHGGIAEAFVCDVTDQQQAEDCVAATIARFGKLDILVNNAALTTQAAISFENVTTERMRAHFEVDVIGSAHCMIASFPYLKLHGGSIINFGSGAGTQGTPLNGPYSIAKEAVRGLTKVAANDWGRFGIRVNVVVPVARTQTFDDWAARQPPGTAERLAANIVLGRLGDPEDDIGQAVVALASPLMKYVTGRTIFLDGGRGGFM